MASPPSPRHSVGYDPAFFEKLIAAEDRHFWFRHRNDVIEAVLQSFLPNMPDGYRVLEVGCGTGNTLRVLERACTRGTVIGMDLFDEGLRIARQRVSCELVQGNIDDMPVPGDFDLICAFDVLEHLRDDTQALRALRQRLRPGGRLLLTVPAHMNLWSYSDEAAEHCRRYGTGQLRSTLEGAGFIVDYSTQFMLLLYPALSLVRRFATWRAGESADDRAFELTSQEFRVVPGLNRCMSWLVAAELPLIRARRSLRLGTSLLAIAHSDAPV